MLDLFSGALGSARPLGRGRATNGEELVWALASLVFPLVDFLLAAFAAPDDERLAMLMPIVFTLATLWLTRLVGARPAWTVQCVVVALLFCYAASLAAGLLGLLSAF